MKLELLLGDCVAVMRTLPEASVDAIVCDPPYGLEFMGKEWDKLLPSKGKWSEDHEPTLEGQNDTPHHRAAVKQPAYLKRCAKCGGNSSGNWNRCACENPEFRQPDHVRLAAQEWHYAWASEAIRVLKPGGHLLAFGGSRTYHRLACAIEDAGFEIRDQIMWVYGSGFPKSHNLDGDHEGWGTALKPAHEPIVVARKSLIGTVAANVLAHGTGAINIDGCRVDFASDADKDSAFPGGRLTSHGSGSLAGPGQAQDAERSGFVTERATGRWPANLIHDGSPEVLAHFPESAGQNGAVSGNEPSGVTKEIYGKFNGRVPAAPRGDAGSAARFFYCAKPTQEERREFNSHPTVKPVALMRYLVRLVTPPAGVVLDPFLGSGTTGIAAFMEEFNFIGIEQSAEYLEIAKRRVAAAQAELALPLFDQA